MRKLVILLLIAVLSSCSVFKKNEKEIAESSTNLQLGSSQSSLETDNSTRASNSRLRLWFTPTPVSAAPIDGYSPPAFPNLGTGALKKDAQNLQKQTKNLMKTLNVDTGAVFAHGYQLAALEFEGAFNEQMNKYKTDAKRDTTSRQEDSFFKKVTKTPDQLTIVVIAGFIILALIFIKKR